MKTMDLVEEYVHAAVLLELTPVKDTAEWEKLRNEKDTAREALIKHLNADTAVAPMFFQS